MSAKRGAASFRAHSAAVCKGDCGTALSRVAFVFALRPSHMVSTPDRPPTEATVSLASGPQDTFVINTGPSSETAVMPAHPSAHAEIQPPARANHSRSSSSSTWLASAAYSVIASRKLTSTAGTAPTTYRWTESSTVQTDRIALEICWSISVASQAVQPPSAPEATTANSWR